MPAAFGRLALCARSSEEKMRAKSRKQSNSKSHRGEIY